MPKARAKLTPTEEAIIRKGGDVPVSAEPVRKHQPVQPAAETPAASPKGVYRPTMVRFTPQEFVAVEKAVKDYAAKRKVKISMNAWIVSACLQQIERDK
jgi:hypothetical protein